MLAVLYIYLLTILVLFLQHRLIPKPQYIRITANIIRITTNTIDPITIKVTSSVCMVDGKQKSTELMLNLVPSSNGVIKTLLTRSFGKDILFRLITLDTSLHIQSNRDPHVQLQL